MALPNDPERKFTFPLANGKDGWYPSDETCLCCGLSLVKPKERIRLFVGTGADIPIPKGSGARLDVYWYGPQHEGRTDQGFRGVNVLENTDDTEHVIEFCSTKCLRQFFNAVVDGLERGAASAR